ncbi:MAG: lysophospholipid acyltransferase family protein [Nocardioidaceae bacterium]
MAADARRFSVVLVGIVAILRPLLRLLTRRDWRGAQNLPGGGFVLAANHLSHVDPLLVSHFLVNHDIPPRFLGKASLFNVPILRSILRVTGQIPVDRGTADASKAFTAAVEAVSEGACVIVYPEGTLTRDPQLWPMTGRTGAARIALATDRPVIPLAQWGAQAILPPYAKRPSLWPRKPVHVWVGEPVDLSDFEHLPPTLELLYEATDRIMAAITELEESIRGEVAPKERFDPRKNGTAETGDPDKPRRTGHD